MSGLEIERKYLIAYPDGEALAAARRVEIVQTYLLSESGETHRVRSWQSGGEVRYFETVKRRVNALTCHEDEREVSEAQYLALLDRRDPARQPIEKTRYRLPFAGHVVEIDVYPFWRDRAILEVELSSEDETVALPDFVRVIREVTDDPRYKNAALAKQIPKDE